MSINTEKIEHPFSLTSKSKGPRSATVTGFYEPDTGSCQYVCSDPGTRSAALIDIVQNFDPAAAATSFESAETVAAYVEQEGLKIEWILDTHPHADHFTASSWLKNRLGGQTAIGEKVEDISEIWEKLYNLPKELDPGACYDKLFSDGDRFKIGNLDCRVMLSPGHTLGSVTYIIGDDCAFVHDTFMHVDAGTARADFPGGSSTTLYHSLQSILALPDDTRLFVGHDYGTDDRHEPAWESTLGQQKADNIHIGGGVSLDEYVGLRDERDATLALPERMLFALRVNLRGGRLPEAEADGHSYFKIPANRFA